MIISKDMVLDSIGISKLIISENLAQPTMPTRADTARYNSVIKPAIATYTSKHVDNPRMLIRMLLAQYVLNNKLDNDFEAQGIHYWGRRISSYVWGAITKKDKEGRYASNKISNFPQLYVLINSECIRFGLCYGNYVKDDSQMVKTVKDNATLQSEIVDVLKTDPNLEIYDQLVAGEFPRSIDKLSISSPTDIRDAWTSEVHISKYFLQGNVPQNIEDQITTTFDNLLKIFLALSGESRTKVATSPKSPDKSYWFVGAHWGEDGDQTKRFVEQGIWENGYKDRYLDEVKQIQPGERIAIKSTYTRKRELPFDNKGHVVSVMAIKAVGTVTKNLGDGRRLEVEWIADSPLREWYFFTNLYTIWEVKRDDWYKEALIDFTFHDIPQDYDRFRNDPFWRGRFGDAIDRGMINEIEGEPYTVDDILADGCFLERSELERILKRLQEKKNVILQGPPGTGKTWLANRLAFALVGTRDESKVKSMQFHPNLSYEDFIRGWRPTSDEHGDGRLRLVDGPFMEMIGKAEGDPESVYVIVIEEINRGNPAQIFGEMLTLLEVDRRSPREALELCYSLSAGERVYIPENLYLIGTMNVADRSLAIVDFAFRRRFAFIDLEPQIGDTWKNWVSKQSGIEIGDLNEIEKRIAKLNEEIAADPNLGHQFCIGHSFITPPEGLEIESAMAWFKEIVETEIGQLLEEYWFDSMDKARNAKQRLIEGL